MKILLYLFVILFAISCNTPSKKSQSTFPNVSDIGYRVKSKTFVSSVDSYVVELEHIKSGADIAIIKNSDPAKTFFMGFKTPPYDDSGLFHIFEHAVLAGSKKYPSKSNFFKVISSSVASFLNAFTGDVWTGYPFVTKSNKEFSNLLSIYLDAIFYPNVVNDPRIIKREGWRYEVNKKTNKLDINGIVFSEMKGVYGSPMTSVRRAATQALLPDTPYAFESGGLPGKISGLQFDQIKQAHKKYYRPQNSYIYLYGNLDYSKVLKEIDQNYLSNFDKDPNFKSPVIKKQTNFNYPSKPFTGIFPGQAGPNKDYVGKGFVLGSQLSPLEADVAHFLLTALVAKNNSPIRLRAAKEQLANSTTYLHSGQDNAMTILFEGSSRRNLKRIEKILNDELKKVVEEGLDLELLSSILNSYEFSNKESKANAAHRGLQYNWTVIGNWIYKDQALADALDFSSQFKKLREKLSDQNYIKAFVSKHFFANKKSRWITMSPDPNFSKKFNAGIEAQIKNAIKEKPLSQYKKEDQVYQEWVKSEDPKEHTDKIPLLKLSDLKEDIQPVPYEVSNLNGTQFMQFSQATNGISYVDLYFNLRGVPENQLKNLKLFSYLIDQTNSGDINFKELTKRIDSNFGGLSFSIKDFTSVKDRTKYTPYLQVSFKYLDENKSEVYSLLAKILTQTTFEPDSQLSDLVKRLKVNMANGAARRGRGLARKAALRSFQGEKGLLYEEISGGSYETYIKSGDLSATVLKPQLTKLLKQIVNKQRLDFVAATTSKSAQKDLRQNIADLKTTLPESVNKGNQQWSFKNQKKYDGFNIPGEVQFIVAALDYQKFGLKHSGALEVYAEYLDGKYLLPKLREQAGAYGAFSNVMRSGHFILETYRDPNLKSSVETLMKAPGFMEKQKFTNENLKSWTLGALKKFYRDQSIYSRSNLMVNLYKTDMTWSDYMKTKNEIINTTPDQLVKINSVISKAISETQMSVSGNAKKLKAEGRFLKKTLTIQ